MFVALVHFQCGTRQVVPMCRYICVHSFWCQWFTAAFSPLCIRIEREPIETNKLWSKNNCQKNHCNLVHRRKRIGLYLPGSLKSPKRRQRVIRSPSSAASLVSHLCRQQWLTVEFLLVFVRRFFNRNFATVQGRSFCAVQSLSFHRNCSTRTLWSLLRQSVCFLVVFAGGLLAFFTSTVCTITLLEQWCDY